MKNFGIMGVVLTVALAACSQEAATPDEGNAVEQGGQAAGDVQGGSISDAMIPLEQLQSQSPTLKSETTSTTIETTTVTAGESVAPAGASPTSPAAPPEPPATPGK